MTQSPFPQSMPAGQPPLGQPQQQPPYGAPPGAVPAQQPPYGAPPGAAPPQQTYGAPPGAVPAQQPSYGAPPGAYPQGMSAAPTFGTPPAASAAATPAGALPSWFSQVPAVRSATAQFGSGGPSMGAAFKKLAESNPTGGGNYLRDGRYVLCLKNLLWTERYSGMTLIAELIVVEAVSQPGMYVANGLPVQPGTQGAVLAVPQAVGEQVSFTSQPDNAKNPNAKAQGLEFLLALFGLGLATLRAAQAEAQQRYVLYRGQGYNDNNMPEDGRDPLDVLTTRYIAPEQPGRGMLIMATTNRKVSQGRFNAENKGKILVLPTYGHIASTPEENAKRRALIDAAQPLPATSILQPAVMPAPAAVPFGASASTLPVPATYPGAPQFGAPPFGVPGGG